ncbi:hypothetical protein [Halalkalibacter akibai]|uniref:Uncharacterized protein n=1 Tax=Halalkalibacter akibai (strain ATCC 43226 / DSM 21942 / CIP 109018 / JCM 9157 / 1139) TaxID=1236973 RepID=W4QPH4_HALA3|nr:hypothetical protein [Halalkalibacter akibai]GAE33249.1 hypothetical protein JCM9157_242 [Halalkalibacter akibai JCM 9157]
MKKLPVGSILFFISAFLWLFLAFTGIGNWSTRVYIFLFIIFLAIGFVNWRMTDRANSEN